MTVRLLLMILSLSVSVLAQMPPIEPGVSQELAKWRAARYSDVRYKLNLTLEKMSPVLKGTMEIRVKVGTRTPSSASGFLDERIPIILDWRKIKGFEDRSTISNIFVNGRPVAVASDGSHADEGVRVPTDHIVFTGGVVIGENVITLDFTSPILPSGSAITRYVDKEDGSEYLYSLFVPSDASTAFPVFDQPDIKAKFDLFVNGPKDWQVVSNSERTYLRLHDSIYSRKEAERLREPPGFAFFKETKPISTYVFAFAAGSFEKVEDPAPRSVPPAVAGGSPRRIGTSGTLSNFADHSQGRFTPALDSSQVSGGKPAFLTEMGSGDAVDVGGSNNSTQPPATAGGTDIGGERVSSPHVSKGAPDQQAPSLTVGLQTPETSIFVRKSQVAKFKPHAAEVFRLNREAVKYFEEYFDYKFPFPKYDLVLIPEFPFGGMEHAGATFLREASIIFPQEPTKNDHINRATLIFHEAAHQWFGDTVTMRWFDDLWLKEGFATFTAYKAMEKIMPEMNAWKVFYERVKQAAYQTDSTKGTTPIYQEIKNLSAAKSAYGNIVYNKAPAFLRQAEFYLGEDKFQTAVRAFLKNHEFGNAGWEDLVREFQRASHLGLKHWADAWVRRPGLPYIRVALYPNDMHRRQVAQELRSGDKTQWEQDTKLLEVSSTGRVEFGSLQFRRSSPKPVSLPILLGKYPQDSTVFTFPNYGDYGYGIFLVDDKSREYVLKNIQNEKDPFLRSMMWGALWDSVREGELDPREFVELVVRVLMQKPAREQGLNAQGSSQALANAQASATEDESTTALLLNRVATAMNYYIEDERVSSPRVSKGAVGTQAPLLPRGLLTCVEEMLIAGMQNSPTLGRRITYYRAFLNIASNEKARGVLKELLAGVSSPRVSKGAADQQAPSLTVGLLTLRTKDKFDIVTRLLILGDPEAPKLLAELEKTEMGDDAKRYAYAARAGIGTAENKAKYWNDFVNNKEISESWIEAAFGPWNSIRHSELTLPYLQKALQELPNHKRNRKIFFVNGWLGAFIGGQRSEEALGIVNKFLADNPNLDNDLRLKILENVDVIERAVRIRGKYPKL